MNNQSRDQSKDDSWFNLDFTSMLQTCGCIARDAPAKLDSNSSNMSRRKLVQNAEGGYEYDTLSQASQDWVDLDFDGVNFDNRRTAGTNNPHTFDDFETKNPIDFDYLMTLTGVNDEENGSHASGLSHGSKKISKMQKEGGTKKESSVKGSSPQKGGAKPRGKRNPWQPHEDAKLLELVSKHGQSWALIATLMEGRTGKQVRDRYTNILRPNIKKGDWTPQEDQHILSLYYEYGHKWSKISSFVPGRTEGQVKNRFYAHIKKKLLGEDDQESPPSRGNGTYLQSLGTPSTPSAGFSSAMPTQNHANNVNRQIQFPQQQNGHGGYQQNQHQNQYPNQNQYQQNFQPFPQSPSGSNSSGDIANSMISYDNGGERVPRNGSNEVFLEPSTNANSPNQQPTKAPLRDEKEIDYILDKMAMFFENNNSLVSVPSQDQDGAHATDKMERVEQLKKRRQALEFLLSQTDKQINTF